MVKKFTLSDSSLSIINLAHTKTSEHPSSEDRIEGTFQAKISPSDTFLKKQEEELIDFKEEYHDYLTNFSSGPIKNEILTINSEHLSSADHFERKFQAKVSPSDQSFEKKNNNFYSSRKNTMTNEKVFIRSHSKWSSYYHLWASKFWRSRWGKIPSLEVSITFIFTPFWPIPSHVVLLILEKIHRQDFYIQSRLWTTRIIIDGVQGITTDGTKQYFIKTHYKWSAYSQFWKFIFLRFIWDQNPSQVL